MSLPKKLGFSNKPIHRLPPVSALTPEAFHFQFESTKNFIFPASVNSRSSRGEYLEATLVLVKQLAWGHPERRIQLIGIDQPQMLNYRLFGYDEKTALARANHAGEQYINNCLLSLNSNSLVFWCGKNTEQKEKTKYIHSTERSEIIKMHRAATREKHKKALPSKESILSQMKSLSHLTLHITTHRLGNYDSKDPSYQRIRQKASDSKEGIIELSRFHTRFAIKCNFEEPRIKAIQRTLRAKTYYRDFNQLIGQVLQDKIPQATKNPEAQPLLNNDEKSAKPLLEQRKYVELYLLLDFAILQALKKEAEANKEVTAHLYDEQTEIFGPAKSIFALAQRVVPPSQYFVYGSIRFIGQEKPERKPPSLKSMGKIIKERISPSKDLMADSPLISQTANMIYETVDKLVQASPDTQLTELSAPTLPSARLR